MATKHNSPCLKKAGNDEPIFVLRAQDLSAPFMIRQWIHKNQHTLGNEKMEGAFKVALEMEAWQEKNPAKQPD